MHGQGDSGNQVELANPKVLRRFRAAEWGSYIGWEVGLDDEAEQERGESNLDLVGVLLSCGS
jgi:hypothetical protein